jgi:hypothetical protein
MITEKGRLVRRASGRSVHENVDDRRVSLFHLPFLSAHASRRQVFSTGRAYGNLPDDCPQLHHAAPFAAFSPREMIGLNRPSLHRVRYSAGLREIQLATALRRLNRWAIDARQCGSQYFPRAHFQCQCSLIPAGPTGSGGCIPRAPVACVTLPLMIPWKVRNISTRVLTHCITIPAMVLQFKASFSRRSDLSETIDQAHRLLLEFPHDSP